MVWVSAKIVEFYKDKYPNLNFETFYIFFLFQFDVRWIIPASAQKNIHILIRFYNTFKLLFESYKII